jgi:hypothetical protein
VADGDYRVDTASLRKMNSIRMPVGVWTKIRQYLARTWKTGTIDPAFPDQDLKGDKQNNLPSFVQETSLLTR